MNLQQATGILMIPFPEGFVDEARSAFRLPFRRAVFLNCRADFSSLESFVQSLQSDQKFARIYEAYRVCVSAVDTERAWPTDNWEALFDLLKSVPPSPPRPAPLNPRATGMEIGQAREIMGVTQNYSEEDVLEALAQAVRSWCKPDYSSLQSFEDSLRVDEDFPRLYEAWYVCFAELNEKWISPTLPSGLWASLYHDLKPTPDETRRRAQYAKREASNKAVLAEFGSPKSDNSGITNHVSVFKSFGEFCKYWAIATAPAIAIGVAWDVCVVGLIGIGGIFPSVIMLSALSLLPPSLMLFRIWRKKFQKRFHFENDSMFGVVFLRYLFGCGGIYFLLDWFQNEFRMIGGWKNHQGLLATGNFITTFDTSLQITILSILTILAVVFLDWLVFWKLKLIHPSLKVSDQQ